LVRNQQTWPNTFVLDYTASFIWYIVWYKFSLELRANIIFESISKLFTNLNNPFSLFKWNFIAASYVYYIPLIKSLFFSLWNIKLLSSLNLFKDLKQVSNRILFIIWSICSNRFSRTQTRYYSFNLMNWSISIESLIIISYNEIIYNSQHYALISNKGLRNMGSRYNNLIDIILDLSRIIL